VIRHHLVPRMRAALATPTDSAVNAGAVPSDAVLSAIRAMESSAAGRGLTEREALEFAGRIRTNVLATKADSSEPKAQKCGYPSCGCNPKHCPLDKDREVQRLRQLAATCYAGLGAECNLPEPWLDALLNAAEGRSFSTDGLLPFTADRPHELRRCRQCGYLQGHHENCTSLQAIVPGKRP